MKKIWTATCQVLKGSWVTTRHFVSNMIFHTLHLFGLRKVRKGAVTIQFPEEKKLLSFRHRSRHRIRWRPDGKPACVACMLCVTVCPSECIFVEAAEDNDPEVQKYARTFTIQLDRCSFCGFCVEACPVDAIRMDTGSIELAEVDRLNLIYDLERLK